MLDPSLSVTGTLAETAPPARPRWLPIFVRPALLAAGLIGAGFALRMLPSMLDPAGLDRVAGDGAQRGLVFVLIAAASCAIGLPRQATAFAGGYAFGVIGGTLLALASQVAGCVIDFAWARIVARPWAVRRMRGRLARFDAFLAAHPFRAVLTLRLLPVGNNLALNLLAGASQMDVRPFLLASTLGYVPQTVIFALLGGGVRVSQALQITLGAALFAMSLAIGVVLLRARSPLPVSRVGADPSVQA